MHGVISYVKEATSISNHNLANNQHRIQHIFHVAQVISSQLILMEMRLFLEAMSMGSWVFRENFMQKTSRNLVLTILD